MQPNHYSVEVPQKMRIKFHQNNECLTLTDCLHFMRNYILMIHTFNKQTDAIAAMFTDLFK